jgi:hypothetical protein
MYQQLAKVDQTIVRDLVELVRKRTSTGAESDREQDWQKVIREVFDSRNQSMLSNPKRARMCAEMDPSKIRRMAEVERAIRERMDVEVAFKERVIPFRAIVPKDVRMYSLTDHPKFKTKRILKFANGRCEDIHQYVQDLGLVVHDTRKHELYHMITGAKLRITKYMGVCGYVGNHVVLENRFLHSDDIYIWDGCLPNKSIVEFEPVTNVYKKSLLIFSKETPTKCYENKFVDKNIWFQGTKVTYDGEPEGYRLSCLMSSKHVVMVYDKGVLTCQFLQREWDLAHFQKIQVFDVLDARLPVKDLQRKILSYVF